MKYFFISLIEPLFYIVVVLLYALGIYHSATKHNTGDVALSVVAFPFGIYRGAEFFWHDDFKDVNWDQRLKGDLQVSYDILSHSLDTDIDVMKFNEYIEKFSSKVNKYPEAKRKELINSARLVCDFYKSSSNDMVEYIIDLKSDSSKITWSDKTKLLGNSLRDKGLDSEVTNYLLALNRLNKKIAMSELDNEKIKNRNQDIRLLYKDYKTMYISSLNDLFKKMFNQNLETN